MVVPAVATVVADERESQMERPLAGVVVVVVVVVEPAEVVGLPSLPLPKPTPPEYSPPESAVCRLLAVVRVGRYPVFFQYRGQERTADDSRAEVIRASVLAVGVLLKLQLDESSDEDVEKLTSCCILAMWRRCSSWLGLS